MKKIRKPQEIARLPKEETAGRIAEWILSAQSGLADWLNRKALQCSPATQRKLLVLFCLVFGTLNLILLIQSLTN